MSHLTPIPEDMFRSALEDLDEPSTSQGKLYLTRSKSHVLYSGVIGEWVYCRPGSVSYTITKTQFEMLRKRALEVVREAAEKLERNIEEYYDIAIIAGDKAYSEYYYGYLDS